MDKNIKHKILPINKQPLLYGYAHYSYSMAMICNPEVSDKKDVIFTDYIDGFNILEKNYICYECEAEISEESSNKIINMHTHLNTNNKYLFYYNKVNGNGTYIINIKYFKHLNKGSKCGIMLSGTLPTKNNFDINDSYKYFYSGERRRFIKLINEFIELDKYLEYELPVWLSITKFNEKIIFKTSDDGIKWDCVREDIGAFNVDEFFIGIYVESKTFAYFNWLYSNYIQTHCDKYLGEQGNCSDVELDMFDGVRIRENYQHNNPFLAIECIEKQTILSLLNIKDFIFNSINERKYVQLKLNERYIPNTDAYEKYDFFHINLIYGYDKNNSLFHIMGYDKNGHIMFYEISFEIFSNAVISDIPGVKVYNDYIFRYVPSSVERYDIDKYLITKFIQEYLNGENSYKMCSVMEAIPERNFGIDVYKCFSEHFYPLINNRRIMHIFLEHKYLMLKRISFFYDNNIISANYFKILYDKFDSIYKKVKIAHNMLLKLYISDGINSIDFNDKKDKICTILDEVKNDEIIAFELLLTAIQ